MLLTLILTTGMFPEFAIADEYADTEEVAEQHTHYWDDGTVVKEPTCSEEGLIVYTCLDCGETMTEAIPEAGHVWGEWITVSEPTCTAAGIRVQSCSVCGETVNEEIPASGHSWSEWIVTAEPTCTDSGERERICSFCGEMETEEIKMQGHRWSEDDGFNPVYCLDCNILKTIAEGSSYDFALDDELWVIAGDTDVDAESDEYWDSLFADCTLTGNWAEDLVMIAKTQIGYSESAANYAVSDNLTRKGYSRYGAWYGAPYSDWDAMFVSFCLYYAGIPVSGQSSCSAWISELNAAGMYAFAGSYTPHSGDLVFYDFDGDEIADHVGIVEWVDENTGIIQTIEGDYDDAVCNRQVSLYDPAIIGYGILPENTEMSGEPAEDETEKTEESAFPAVTLTATVDGTVITVNAPEGAFPEGVQMQAVKADPEGLLVAALEEIGYSAEEAPGIAQSIIESGADLSEFIQNFTLTFYLPEDPGSEIEPEKEVEVRFENLSIDTEEVAVFHDDGVSVDKLGADADGANITVSVPSFSDTGAVDLGGIRLLAAKAGTGTTSWVDQYGAPCEPLDDFPTFLKWLGDQYYYPDGQLYEEPKLGVEISGPSPASDSYEAGQILKYNISYDLKAAETFPDPPYQGPTSLFDNYKDITLTLKLPKGLILEQCDYAVTSSPAGTDPDVEHTYTISIPGTAPAANGATDSFQIQVFIGNNGTDKAISEYVFAPDMVTLSAEWDLVDKRTGTPVVLKTYNQTVNASADKIQTTSPDVWDVEKTNSGSPVVDKSAKTVTFKWQVNVGMVVEEAGSKTMVSQNSDYARTGRDAVTTMTLGEQLSAKLVSGGSVLQPKDGKISISKSASGNNSVDVALNSGAGSVIVWPESSVTDSKLLMDSLKVDKDGDGTAETEVPSYTTYYVTAVYDITDDMIREFNETADAIESVNTASTTAVLPVLGTQTGSASNTQNAPLYLKDPASFRITKTLIKPNGESVTYNNEHGTITYTLTLADDSAAEVYTKNGSSYTKYTGDLQQSKSTSSNIYYVLPGRAYKITETIAPEHTDIMKPVGDSYKLSPDPLQGGDSNRWTASFTNKETLGTITVRKQDDKNHNLPGAEFALYRVDGQNEVLIEKLTTKSPSGTCVFGVTAGKELPYGTYKLYETNPPAGYSKMDAENHLPMIIVIDDDHQNVTTEILKNKETKATVDLNKYVGSNQSTVSTDTFTKWTSKFPQATFLLQVKNDNGEWVTAKDINGRDVTEMSLNESGSFSSAIEVPATKADGTAHYEYRFRETLTENSGYVPVNHPADDLLHGYSEVFTLDQGQTYTVPLFNRKTVAVMALKNAYQYDSKGNPTVITTATVPVTLYRYEGTGTPTSADQLDSLGEKTARHTNSSSNPTAQWTNLPYFGGADGSETQYTYYIKETLGSDFVFGKAQLGSTDISESDQIMIGGERYIKVSVGSNNNYTVTLYNYKKAIPVQIVKKTDSSDPNVTISGCEVTVYKDRNCTQVAADAQNSSKLLENLTLTTVFYLEQGVTYYYKETKEVNSEFLSATTDDKRVDIEKGGVIIAGTVTPGEKATVKTYEVKNKLHPRIRIDKKNAVSTGTNVTGSKFAVYTKTPGGTYTPYLDSKGQAVVIDKTNERSNTWLPPGEYYFTESTVPGGFLDPNYPNSRDVYAEKDTTNTYIYDSTAGKTFIKCDVPEGQTSKTFTFYNMPLNGSVRVQKTLNGSNFSKAGFQVLLMNGTSQVQSGITNSSGQVTFNNVPVYNTDTTNPASYGTVITYTIKEGPASSWTGGEDGDLAKTYYLVKDGQNVQVAPGSTSGSPTTKGTDNKTLTVDNSSYISISAVKFQYDNFMHSQGGRPFKMNGVTIGLFRRVVAEGDNGDWTYVSDADTVNGAVSFDMLPREVTPRTDTAQKYEYALVEMDTNSETYFPVRDEVFKETPPAGSTTISHSDLTSKYNYLLLPGSSIVNSKTDYNFNTDNEPYKGDLYNTNHWVQFHVTKYLDKDVLPDNYTDADHGTAINYSEDTPLNECVFSLYRYKLEEGQSTVEFDRNSWKLIGTYTSGTLYDSEMLPLDGQFITDENSNITEKYVYVLVEDNTGPTGAVINPNFEYTFWHYPGVTVTCTANGKTIGRNYSYNVDRVTHTDVLNSRVKGKGIRDILLASLRLSKWRDSYDESGDPEKDYAPLANTHFAMFLAGESPETGTPISEMTAYILTGGSGSQKVAFAQSGTFRLMLEGTETYPDQAVLVEYEVEGRTPKEYPVTVTELTSEEHPDFHIYGVAVDIYETAAPDGYGYSPMAYETYLCFVDKVLDNDEIDIFRFHEDLYLVWSRDPAVALAEDQTVREWYITDASQGDRVDSFGNDIRRIVDYPMENTPVEIHKVGYVPSKDTLNKDSRTIAAEDPTAVPLSGVKMILKRKDTDGKFKPWNYQTNDWGSKEFTTGDDGKFFFHDGLPMGTYQIYETDLGPNGEYENAYKESDGHYREFTVGGVAALVYMANPRKIDLKITKTKTGTADKVSGMTFELGSETAAESGGVYTFSGIPTGTYTLTEKAGRDSGVSDRYFAEMFAAKYPDLAQLVNGSMLLGYTYENKALADGSDVEITAISPWDAKSGAPILSLDVENPGKESLKLRKQDLDDKNTALSNVTFDVYYKPFDAVSGNVVVDLPDAKATYELTKAEYDALVDTELRGWKYFGERRITNSDGTVNVNNLEPGVYAFLESVTPPGYEHVLDTDGNILVYTAVVKDGLNVNVTVNPDEAAVPGVTDPVKTNFEKEDGAINVVAVNRRMAPMYAKKTTLPESWNLINTPAKNWKITLKLYEAKTGGDPVATAVIDNTTDQDSQNNGKGIVFVKPDNTPAYFSVGKGYWLEETVETAADPSVDPDYFVWTSYKVQPYNADGSEGTPTTVTVNTDTRYPVTAGSVNGLTVTAVNQYLYGEVTFIKYNGDQSDTVHEASFEVQIKDKDGNWTRYEAASMSELEDESGKLSGRYCAFIPLTSPKLTDYRILETNAPHGYILDPDPEKRYIDVQLSAENNVKNFDNIDNYEPKEGEYIKNYSGSGLQITKYNNIYSAENKGFAAEDSAQFTLYHEKSPNTWEKVEGPVDIVGTKGLIEFETTLTPGEKYAVAETYFNSATFSGLESIYAGGEKKTLQDIPYPTAANPENKIHNAYVFNCDGSQEVIALEAYNIPVINPVIVKVDVGQYPDGVYPMANFNIYEVPAGFVDNEENVADLVKNCKNTDDLEVLPRLVFSSSTGTEKEYSGVPGAQGTFKGTETEWISVNEIENRWNPGKTYILAETKVSAHASDVHYDTMIKDDPRVEWYVRINPVADPNPQNPPVYYLKNINGFADVKVTKDVVESTDDPESDVADGKVESLLEGDRKVVYTLTPEVTGKNQMLSSFVLKESGLIKPGTEDDPDYDDPVIPDYIISNVLVGGAVQVIPDALDLTETPEIKAKVTFSTGEEKTVTVPASLTETVEVKPDTSGAKSFTVEYFSEGVMDATDNAYKLGEEFRVGASKVYMTVKQTPDGEPGGGADGKNLAKKILSFTNRTEAVLAYPEWSAEGVKAAEPTEKKDDDTADVDVKQLVLPTVSIQKSVVLEENQEHVTTGSVLQYSIEVKNTSPDNVNFINPVIVDVLPTGVTFYETEITPVKVYPEGLFTVTAMPRTGVPTQMVPKYDDEGEETGEMVYGDAETAVIFNVTGELEPGATLTLTFSGLVGESALLYETSQGEVKLINDAYLTTAKHTYYTEDNPWGYSFKANQNAFGDPLADVANDLSPEAKTHESGVHEALGSAGSKEADYSNNGNSNYYVYIGSECGVTVVEGANLIVNKAVRGDRDDDFHDDEKELGIATRTNSKAAPDPTEGWVDWRLLVNNGYQDDRHDLVIGDVIPKVGDDQQRNSKWDVNFDDFQVVKNGNTLLTEDDYTVYYYTGPTSGAQSVVKNAMKTIRTAPPEGAWTTSVPEDKSSVTAFIMMFDSDIVLKAGHSIMVTYHTLVQDYPENDDFYDNRAFQNANNRFHLVYAGHTSSTIDSNVVGVTLMDQLVQVEGDVWIDEDWDSLQKPWPSADTPWPAGARRDYSKYQIIQNLANGIAFSITDNRKAANGNSWSEGTDHGSNTDPGYGESIRHFKFEELFPAMAVDRNGLYENETLVVENHLKGSDPANYSLSANISNSDLLQIFELTDYGENYYISADPSVNPNYVLTWNSLHSLDSNFFQSTRDGASYATKPFYIPYANEVDQSKDIGFRMVRDLVITKVAKDDPNVRIPGAEFQIFGPFNEDKGTGATGSPLWFSGSDGVYTYVSRRPGEQAPEDTTGLTQTLVTDKNGQISVSGINWWKEYVIKETKAAPGYNIEGATVEATAGYDTDVEAIKGEDGVFVVKLPSETKVTRTNGITVSNPRGVADVPYVKKTIEGTPIKDETFKFTLDFASDMDKDLKEYVRFKNEEGDYTGFTPQTKILTLKAGESNKKEVFCDDIWFLTEGVYKFTIEEVQQSNNAYDPDDPNTGWAVDPAFSYDGSKWSYVVEVEINSDGKLAIKDSSYTKKEDETTVSSEQAEFCNKYTPKPVDHPFYVKKILRGEPLPDAQLKDITFTFELRDEGSNDSTGYIMPTDRTVQITAAEAQAGVVKAFDKVKFVKANAEGEEYVFTIRELNTAEPTGTTHSIVYDDSTIWRVRVKVENVNDKLQLAAEYPKYEATGREASTEKATFTNTYVPEKTTYTPEVTKIVEGEPRPTENCKQDFWFDLEFVSATYPNGEETPVGYTLSDPLRVKVHDSGTSTFGTISFNRIGTYVFKIVEEDGTAEEKEVYTFDTVPRYLTVVVSDNNDGTLKRTFSYSRGAVPEGAQPVDDASMINIYQPKPTEYAPPVRKTLVTDYGPTVAEKNFSFKLLALTGPTGGSDMANGTTKEFTIAIPAGTTSLPDPQPTFDKITYKKAGTYTYQITETVPTADPEKGIIYSTATWNLTVIVEDVGRKLEVTSHAYVPSSGTASTSQADFANTYQPEPTVFTPKATKTIEVDFGPTVEDKTFKFDLALVSAAAKDETTDVRDGQVVPDKDGTPFVSETKEIKVKAGESVEEVLFSVITYTKAGTYTYKIQEQVSGEKGITDDTEEKTLEVIVTDKNGALFIEKYTYKAGGKTIETRSTTADGDVLTGLEAETGAAVENVYKPEPTVFTPKATKTITTDFGPTVVSKTFTFDLTADAAAAKDGKTDVSGGQVDADGNPFVSETKSIEVAAGETVGEVLFSQITYTMAGTYTYTVQEKVSGEKGITDDTEEKTLEVTVTDKDGALFIEKYTYKAGEKIIETRSTTADGDVLTGLEAETGAVVENDYKPKPTVFTPEAAKTITVDFGPTVVSKTFKFDLNLESALAKDGKTDVKDGADIQTETKTIEIAAGETGGDVIFSEITFTKAGTYVYTIQEQVSGEKGITDDTDVRKLEIIVTDKDGELFIENHAYSDAEDSTEPADTEAETGAVITNVYKPEPVDWAPKVRKLMSGEPTVEDKKFTFTLTADESNPEGGASLNAENSPDTVSVTVPAGAAESKAAAFGDITFSKAGTYKFTAAETPGTAGNPPVMTYDSRTVVFTVRIKDTDGSLTVEEVTYQGDAETDEKDKINVTARFTNVYTPKPADVPLGVKKSVNGRMPAGASFTFIFNLTAKEGTPMPEKTSVAVIVPESYAESFGTIHYTKAGTYTYNVQEAEGSDSIVRYDTAPKTVTVVVTDDKGTLKAEVSGAEMSDVGIYEVKVTNTITSGSLRIKKTVTGAGDKNQVFPFRVDLDAAGIYHYAVYNVQGARLGGGDIQSGGTIGLAHDQYAIIIDLPAGCRYAVTEMNNEGYTVFSTGEVGKIEADKVLLAAFTNSKTPVPPGPPRQEVPKTGEDNLLFMSMLAMVFSAIGMILTLLFGRKRRRPERK